MTKESSLSSSPNRERRRAASEASADTFEPAPTAGARLAAAPDGGLLPPNRSSSSSSSKSNACCSLAGRAGAAVATAGAAAGAAGAAGTAATAAALGASGCSVASFAVAAVGGAASNGAFAAGCSSSSRCRAGCGNGCATVGGAIDCSTAGAASGLLFLKLAVAPAVPMEALLRSLLVQRPLHHHVSSHLNFRSVRVGPRPQRHSSSATAECSLAVLSPPSAQVEMLLALGRPFGVPLSLLWRHQVLQLAMILSTSSPRKAAQSLPWQLATAQLDWPLLHCC